MRAICKKALRGKRPKVIPSRAMRSVDHTGREFSSLQAMCDFWHINISTYHNRMRAGLPVKAVLTAPVRRRSK